VSKKVYLLFSFWLVVLLVGSTAGAGQKWWQKWPTHPKVPKITAKQVRILLNSGHKMVFVYAGYKVKRVVCGSLIIPYGLVPPFGDGSRVRLRIPKDYWIMCY